MDIQPMNDVVVVVPGILGSVLAEGSTPVWGTKGALLQALQLGDRLHPSRPLDPVSLIKDWSAIPELWKVDGYDLLVDFLRARFAVDESNFLAFPYDWRQSNEHSALRLAELAGEALERRRSGGHPDAKLVLVCHSMGGLVARWFLDVLGRGADTRRLVTIGTPYRGAVKALRALVNGVVTWAGPVGTQLTALARALPSVYELLPTYRCVAGRGDRLVRLEDSDVAERLDPELYGAAQEFQRRLAGAMEQRSRAPEYAVNAVITSLQPTPQFARMVGDKLEVLRSYQGEDYRGDGTVPRQSMAPPEWIDDSLAAVGPGETHAHLQNSRVTHNQLWSILTARPWRDMAPPVQLSLTATEVVEAGGTLSVDVSTSEEGLALVATLKDDDCRTLFSRRLSDFGTGTYRLQHDGILPAGIHRLTVGGPGRGVVEPVSDLVTVLPGAWT